MCRFCHDDKKCHREKKCKGVKLINHCDLPYFICKPGCYRVCENLKYDPLIQGTSAITIETSDVVLELGCHSLYQKEDNLLATTGIKINNGIERVSIKAEGGSVENFKGWGVDFEGSNSDIELIGINVLGCGTDERDENFNALDGGINIGKTSPPPDFIPDNRVTNTLVDNVKVANCKNFGILIFSKENFTLSNSTIENISSETNPVTLMGGVVLLQPITIDISGENVTIVNNTIRNIKTSVLELSLAPLAGIAGIGVGMLIFGYKNVFMSNCQLTNTNVSGTGVFCNNYLGSGNVNCVYDNCQFSQCSSEGPSVSFIQNFHTSANTGFNGLRECGEMTFRNCLFSDSSAASGALVAGLQLAYGKNYVIDNCQIRNIQNTSQEFFTAGAGIFLFMGRSFFSTYVDGNIDNERGSMSNLIVKNTEIQEISCQNGPASGITYDGGLWNTYVEPVEQLTLTNPVNEYNLKFKDLIIQNVNSTIGASNGITIDKGYMFYNFNFFNATGVNLNPTPYKITNELKDVIFQRCIISDCHGIDASSSGIQICAVKNPSVDCCIVKDCVNGILLTGGNIPALSQLGFYPQTDFDFGTTERGLITSNKIDNIIDASVAITEVEISSQIATVTMLDTTGYFPLSYINITGIGAPSYVNGTWLIQSVTPTTVSFALLGGDVPLTPVVGSATKGAAYLNIGNINNVFVDNIAALTTLPYVGVADVVANNNRSF